MSVCLCVSVCTFTYVPLPLPSADPYPTQGGQRALLWARSGHCTECSSDRASVESLDLLSVVTVSIVFIYFLSTFMNQ